MGKRTKPLTHRKAHHDFKGFNITEISIISKVIYKYNIIQAKMTTFFKKIDKIIYKNYGKNKQAYSGKFSKK